MNSTYEHFDIQRLNAISITEVAQALGCELRKALITQDSLPMA